MHTGGYQGLPQTGMAPLVHYEVAVAGHTSRAHEYYGAQWSAPLLHVDKKFTVIGYRWHLSHRHTYRQTNSLRPKIDDLHQVYRMVLK